MQPITCWTRDSRIMLFKFGCLMGPFLWTELYPQGKSEIHHYSMATVKYRLKTMVIPRNPHRNDQPRVLYCVKLNNVYHSVISGDGSNSPTFVLKYRNWYQYWGHCCLITTWVIYYSPRAKPEDCGELPRSWLRLFTCLVVHTLSSYLSFCIRITSVISLFYFGHRGNGQCK